MADGPDNLVLEQLRLIRKVVEDTRDDVNDLKFRMSTVEEHLGQQLIQFGQLNKRMDRFDERLGRIERRLDLVEA